MGLVARRFYLLEASPKGFFERFPMLSKKKKKKSCKHANELSLNETSSLVRVGWMVCLCVQNLPGVYVT